MSRTVRTLLTLAGAFLLAHPVPAEIIEELVANVNGGVITKTDVEIRERDIQASLFRSLTGAELDRAMSEIRQTLLVDMINERLLFQRAERLGLDLEQVYQSSLENIKVQNNIQTDEELYALLRQQGMTREEFRENLLKYNVPDIMINIEVRQKIGVRDQEAKKYYEQNKDSFSHPTTYTFREIAVLLDQHSRQDALEIAEKVVGEAAAGADFEGLVEKYSEAPSREQGGLVENLPAPEMAAKILEGLVPLQPGEVSQPVETTRAIFVLKLVERVGAHHDALEKVLPQIEVALKREKFEDELEAYLRNLWSDNWICVFPKYEKEFPVDRYAEPPACS